MFGLPALAPFDRILVSAEADHLLPQGLLDQLADGGLMVIGGRHHAARCSGVAPTST